MKPIRKEKIRALVNETLQRFASEGLTVREAKHAAGDIANEITKAAFDAAYQFTVPKESASNKTDLISSENLP